MKPGSKLPKQLAGPYWTSLLSIMGYLRKSCQIKVTTLRVSWWPTSVSWWECRKYGPVHTIHRSMASVRGSTPPWLICWECYPQEKKSEWKNHIGTLVHAYNCTKILAMGFSPYYLMYRRQPHLPVDVTLGLAPQTTTALDTSKFVQKMRECTKWAQKRLKPSEQRKPNATNKIMTNTVQQQPWRLEIQF